MRAILLTVMLGAAACASESGPPAQSPSTTSSTVSVADQPASNNPTVDTTPTITPTTPAATYPAAPATTTPRATPRSDNRYTQPNQYTQDGASPRYVDQNTATSVGTSDMGGVTAAASAPVAGTTSPRAVTAGDQGNSADELRITAAIRKGVMNDGSLSAMAKNVTIVTVGSKVTLRGTVKNADERSTVEMRARQTTGVTEVDDQLTVK